MLVWSVHGHGAVVTRNSWKDGVGVGGGGGGVGRAVGAEDKREPGRGEGLWRAQPAVDLPWLRRSTAAGAVVQGCAHTALGSPPRPGPAAVLLMARRVCTAICPCIPQLGHLGSGPSLLCGTAVAAVLG